MQMNPQLTAVVFRPRLMPSAVFVNGIAKNFPSFARKYDEHHC